jgi:hypothetical protein
MKTFSMLKYSAIAFSCLLSACETYPTYVEQQPSASDVFFANLDRETDECLAGVGKLTRKNAVERMECIVGKEYRAYRDNNFDNIDVARKYYLDRKDLAEQFKAGKITKEKYEEKVETIDVNRNALIQRLQKEQEAIIQSNNIQLQQIDLYKRQVQATEAQAVTAKQNAENLKNNFNKPVNSRCETYAQHYSIDGRIITECR